MKRVLLTGATGFIGRHSIEPLLAAGYEVHAVSRRGAVLDRVESHEADLLSDPAPLLDRVRPTHLLHFAWNVPPAEYWTSIDNFRWVEASMALLRAFADAGGRRVVFAGTCAEYDWSADCCAHDTPLRPQTVYGTCKNALRELFESFCAARGVSGAWGRIFFLYGPHEQPSRLVASIVRGIAARQPVACTDGVQQRDFLHVADVASAFAALLDSDFEGVADIGSGVATPVRDVILTIARDMDGERWVRLGERSRPATEPLVIKADTRGLFDEIGWRPRYDLETGLKETIAWWTA